MLAAHANRGERDHKHPHYLRSTIYCSACGGRLVYSENTGNGGTYKYYFCVKRKTKANNCTRPAVRVERIEDGIADFYRQFQVKPAYAAQIRQAVRAELAVQQDDADRDLRRATTRQQQVKDERQKLLQAHYAGAVPQDLLATEMKRLTRELADAEAEIKAARATNTDVEATLALALNAASHCEVAYLSAPDAVRRQINQGFFERLLIGEDGSVEQAELTEPFRLLLDSGTALTSQMDVKAAQATPEPTSRPGLGTDRSRPSSVFLATYEAEDETSEDVTYCDKTNTHRRMTPAVRGVNSGVLVELRGFEPLTPSMRTTGIVVHGGHWARQAVSSGQCRLWGAEPVAARLCCTVGLYHLIRRGLHPYPLPLPLMTRQNHAQHCAGRDGAERHCLVNFRSDESDHDRTASASDDCQAPLDASGGHLLGSLPPQPTGRADGWHGLNVTGSGGVVRRRPPRAGPVEAVPAVLRPGTTKTDGLPATRKAPILSSRSALMLGIAHAPSPSLRGSEGARPPIALP